MNITDYGIAFNDIPSYYIRSPKTCLNCGLYLSQMNVT